MMFKEVSKAQSKLQSMFNEGLEQAEAYSRENLSREEMNLRNTAAEAKKIIAGFWGIDGLSCEMIAESLHENAFSLEFYSPYFVAPIKKEFQVKILEAEDIKYHKFPKEKKLEMGSRALNMEREYERGAHYNLNVEDDYQQFIEKILSSVLRTHKFNYHTKNYKDLLANVRLEF